MWLFLNALGVAADDSPQVKSLLQLIHEVNTYGKPLALGYNVQPYEDNLEVRDGCRLATCEEAVVDGYTIRALIPDGGKSLTIELLDGFMQGNKDDLTIVYAVPKDGPYGSPERYSHYATRCGAAHPSNVEFPKCHGNCVRFQDIRTDLPLGYHLVNAAEANEYREEIGRLMNNDDVIGIVNGHFNGQKDIILNLSEEQIVQSKVAIIRDVSGDCSAGDLVKAVIDQVPAPEGYRIADTFDAALYYDLFIAMIEETADIDYIKLKDGLIDEDRIVNYASPPIGIYGRKGFEHQAVICEEFALRRVYPEVPKCSSDCVRIIRSVDPIPQGFHQATAAEMNVYRSWMHRLMDKDEPKAKIINLATDNGIKETLLAQLDETEISLVGLVDGSIAGIKENLEIKMTLPNVDHELIAIMRGN